MMNTREAISNKRYNNTAILETGTGTGTVY